MVSGSEPRQLARPPSEERIARRARGGVPKRESATGAERRLTARTHRTAVHGAEGCLPYREAKRGSAKRSKPRQGRSPRAAGEGMGDSGEGASIASNPFPRGKQSAAARTDPEGGVLDPLGSYEVGTVRIQLGPSKKSRKAGTSFFSCARFAHGLRTVCARSINIQNQLYQVFIVFACARFAHAIRAHCAHVRTVMNLCARVP